MPTAATIDDNEESHQPLLAESSSEHWVPSAEERVCDALLWLRRKTALAFWLLGLCNNYAYVIMLSAAHDLLHRPAAHSSSVLVNQEPQPATAGRPSARHCNSVSTGAILLADILPALLVKVLGPLLLFSVSTGRKMALVVALSVAAFALGSGQWQQQRQWATYVGVVCASLGAGLGELTLLSHCGRYDSAAISVHAWSSGTGCAGVVASGAYALLTSCLGLSTGATLLVMLVCPLLMAATYWLLMPPPHFPAPHSDADTTAAAASTASSTTSDSTTTAATAATITCMTANTALVTTAIAAATTTATTTASAAAASSKFTELPDSHVTAPYCDVTRSAGDVTGRGDGITRFDEDVTVSNIDVTSSPSDVRWRGGDLTTSPSDVTVRDFDVIRSSDDVSRPVDDTVLTWSDKTALLPSLLSFMLPLGAVYFLEYFINQALLELVWLPAKNTTATTSSIISSSSSSSAVWNEGGGRGGVRLPDHASQYRWLQLAYQCGVFVSRSSAGLWPVRRVWPLALLQALNVGLVLAQVLAAPVRVLWPLVLLIVWEGLLGGCAYVNTFSLIHGRSAWRRSQRQFALATVSLADSLGIVLAGAVALPVHRAICRRPTPL